MPIVLIVGAGLTVPAAILAAKAFPTLAAQKRRWSDGRLTPVGEAMR